MRSSTLAQSFTLGMLGTAFFIASPAMAASMYSITDLGTLRGYDSSIAFDINNNGQIVGTVRNGAFDPSRAFIWENGTMTDLGTLPGYTATSGAFGINDNRQVVGVSTDRIPSRAGYNYHAFRWENGILSDLGTLGGSSTNAIAINNLGQVVGSATITTGQGRAYRTAPNSPINSTSDLGIDVGSGSNFSEATDINNSGDVIGYISVGTGSAFLWKDGVINELEGLSDAYGINDLGQIVGAQGGSYTAGILWDNGVAIELGTLGGGGSATDINNNGQIVGGTSTSKEYSAYLWENGVLYNLNDLIPKDSGWQLGIARAINDRGQIVGDGIINNQSRGFLLTPLTKTAPKVPEPNYTFATLAISIMSAFYLSKRKLSSK